MSDAERYSIKEMISELKDDLRREFSDVKLHLTDIERRTRRNEWYITLTIGGALVLSAIGLLSLKAVIQSVVDDNKNSIIKESVNQTVSEVNRIYNLTGVPLEK